MRIKYSYNDNDYIELYKYCNERNGVANKERLINLISIPGILFLVLLIIIGFIGEFKIVPVLCWIIFSLIWFIVNKLVYSYRVRRKIKSIIKKEIGEELDLYYKIKLTVDNDGIFKEINGIETSIRWEGIEGVYLTKKYIYIRLIDGTYITIPIKSIDNGEKEELIKILSNYINIIQA